ncbi:protein-methionine-sulfoxide reductase heme-binding subunit MsrQ [Hyalangium sp.]|uniref:sulfite oxidase heme-binding subunit YedZ n=1 Tax=Hyalangium sp. TaxID=2028555 RepID=UPI002D2D8C0F|nr:protein-methionine-sulfoxide reductase heme-binding subunit MsrQ [Hyalangium sp.]HYH99595.1 protein-methionine-sulfoxide reductase heme-binding subunit MsrQ [Hyalangium sp.]
MASPPLPWLNPAVLVGGLAPLALLAVQGAQGTLGPNVIEAVLNQTGLLALVFLVGSLACTPLKLLFGWTWPIRVRKLVGLMAFGYAVLHFLTYAVADQGLALRPILEDITKRKFIAVGLIALVLLVPLAVTSTNAAVRRLGFPAWKRLHRLGYLAAALGVIHFVWRVKQDVTEPFIYGAVLTVLLGIRAVEAVRKRRRTREAPRPA